jgi:hypothetical protein
MTTLDTISIALKLVELHIMRGKNVCHDPDPDLQEFLQTLPYGEMLSLHGITSHIAQNCDELIAAD